MWPKADPRWFRPKANLDQECPKSPKANLACHWEDPACRATHSRAVADPLDIRRSKGLTETRIRHQRRSASLCRCCRRCSLCPEQGRDAVARYWPADQIALHLVAARTPQELRLLLRIDSLGDDLQPQRSCQRDHGRDERHRVGFLEHRDDEGPVDLERLHRELGEIAERRIAGAEVINRD